MINTSEILPQLFQRLAADGGLRLVLNLLRQQASAQSATYQCKVYCERCDSRESYGSCLHCSPYSDGGDTRSPWRERAVACETGIGCCSACGLRAGMRGAPTFFLNMISACVPAHFQRRDTAHTPGGLPPCRSLPRKVDGGLRSGELHDDELPARLR